MGNRLAGKVAVITGGARGMGEATARLFVREGANVVLADILEDEGRRLAAELKAVGGKAEFVHCDVTNPEDVRNVMSSAVRLYGKLDILFNNAGIVEPETADVASCSEEVFDRVIAVNLKGNFLGLKYAVAVMLESGGGSIINTASVTGLVGVPGMCAYAASKGGILALTKTAALDYALQGIRVNAIVPGGVDTQIGEARMAQLDSEMREAARQGLVAMQPIGRFAQPEEIAPLVLFLASDESAIVTGAVYPIDGGWTAQ
jgi:NAD(P)-dependent dehydrogenase (short-subunit alcohol dehydrogenase family)